jgi:hypothetical protein
MGDLTGDIQITGGVTQTGRITIEKNIRPSGIIRLSDGQMQGLVRVGERLEGLIQTPDQGLSGQVVLNAKSSPTNTQWWASNGTVRVGTADFKPSSLSPSLIAPNYTVLPATLGGGSVGVVPFAFQPAASFPLASGGATPRQSVQRLALGEPVRLAFYGPLQIAELGGVQQFPVVITRPGATPTSPPVDVTNLFAYEVSPANRRELRIKLPTGASGASVLGPSFASVTYTVTPTTNLLCNRDSLLLQSTQPVPAVQPFSYSFELVYDCSPDIDPTPDPVEIATNRCYDCFDAATGLVGSDGILDTCQTNGGTPLEFNNRIWTGCTRCTGQCANRYPSDFSADGVANVDDVFIYLNAFNASRPCADADGNGVVNIDDVFIYLNIFFAGTCPCQRPVAECPFAGC